MTMKKTYEYYASQYQVLEQAKERFEILSRDEENIPSHLQTEYLLMKTKKLELKFLLEREDLTDDHILRFLKRNPTKLKDIPNPSEYVCMESIKNTNGFALKLIQNPTEEMQLEAIREYYQAILNISSPSQEMLFISIFYNTIGTSMNWKNLSYRHVRSLLKQRKLKPIENVYKMNERVFKEQLNSSKR